MFLVFSTFHPQKSQNSVFCCFCIFRFWFFWVFSTFHPQESQNIVFCGIPDFSSKSTKNIVVFGFFSVWFLVFSAFHAPRILFLCLMNIFYICFVAALVLGSPEHFVIACILFLSVSDFPKDSQFRLPKWKRCEFVNVIFDDFHTHAELVYDGCTMDLHKLGSKRLGSC